jgi:hypothetical protein
MKRDEIMENLTICAWDLSKLWHTMGIMHICYMNIMEISSVGDL